MRNCSNPLLYDIYKFSHMIWSRNLNGILDDKWSLSMILSTFTKNVFWFVNCQLSYYQLYYVQTSTLQLAWRLPFQVRSCRPGSISRKNYLFGHIYDVICRLHLSRGIFKEGFQWIPCEENSETLECKNFSTESLIRVSKFS